MEKLLFKARELAKEMQGTEEYKNFFRIKQENDSNAELQEKINRVSLLEINIKQLSTKGALEESKQIKMDNYLKEYTKTREELLNDKNILLYNQTRQTLEAILTQINNIFLYAINGDDPMADDENLFKTSSGGCGGCKSGGCGK